MEPALEAKVLPPRLPDIRVSRPRLDPLLDGVLSRRLTSIAAPTGFAKSTLLAAWAEQQQCAWYTCTDADDDLDTLFHGLVASFRLRVSGVAEAVQQLVPGRELGPDAESEQESRAAAHATRLCGLLQEHLDTDVALVVDDLHELTPGSGGGALIAGLARQAPRRLHLVLLSRDEPPFATARMRAQGEAAQLDGAVLAFDPSETLELVTLLLPDEPHPHEVADELYATTRGWPAAVRLALDAARAGARLPRPGTGLEPEQVVEVLAEEVLGSLPSGAVRLVRRVADLGSFTPELCAALGIDDPATTLHTLQRRGLAYAVEDASAGYALHPLVRASLRAEGTDDGSRRDTLRTAGRWLVAHGQLREGMRLLAEVDAGPAVAELLTTHGRALVAAGESDSVLRMLQRLDDHELAPSVRAELTAIDGEARHASGDWGGALARLEQLRSHHGLPPAAAWRTAFIHHQQGDLTAALAAHQSCDRDAGDLGDIAMLDAVVSATHWMRGEFDACRELAERAHEAATRLDDARVLAASHTALAMLAAVAGDRRTNDAHYLRALTHAERAGDVHQLIRIRNNRGSRYLEEGLYPQALAELDLAVDQADLAGYAALRALALTNRGQVLSRTGRPDEALRDLTAARNHFERIGSHMLAYPLTQTGEIHAARGEVALARAAFEEADRLAAASGDVQARVPALAGLARLLAESDPDVALRAAERAVSLGQVIGHPAALLARGWVALVADDAKSALADAELAAAVAGEQRDRASLAGAVELSAIAAPDRRLPLLREAAASWGRLGHVLDEARVRARLATESGATSDEHDDGRRAVELLRGAGCLRDIPPASLTASGAVAQVEVLGGFRLQVGERVVATGDWGSRKPRDLLKLLIARRGAVRRDVVVEMLWPDESPDRTARRLSVALSTLRGVLDPEHHYPADHFVIADRDALWLDPEHWEIDLERFLTSAETALRLVETGDGGSTASLLRAEQAMTGEAFEEDAYADWAREPRDHARTIAIHTLRALTDDAARTGALDRASRLLLRLLQRDPYDEPAHRQLVEVLLAAGRHGEARRMYRAYCERMAELDVEPAPFPDRLP